MLYSKLQCQLTTEFWAWKSWHWTIIGVSFFSKRCDTFFNIWKCLSNNAWVDTNFQKPQVIIGLLDWYLIKNKRCDLLGPSVTWNSVIWTMCVEQRSAIPVCRRSIPIPIPLEGQGQYPIPIPILWTAWGQYPIPIPILWTVWGQYPIPIPIPGFALMSIAILAQNPIPQC